MKRPSNDKIIAALQATAGMVTYAAKKLDCDYSTLYGWLRNSEVLRDALTAVKESHIDLAETILLSNVKEGKEASVFFLLKCLGKNRGFIEKSQIEHSGDIEIKIEYDDKA